jgi:signal transduction histidine kinase
MDEGRGLSETERNRAFDRFWQAHEERDGFGLGLAIVRRLTAGDGGDVELRDGSPGGLDAVVRLHRG